MVWYRLVWFCLVSYGFVLFVMVLFCLVCYGMVWYGLIQGWLKFTVRRTEGGGLKYYLFEKFRAYLFKNIKNS